MAAALRRDSALALDFAVPTGGYYIWCRLPEGVEQPALLANAAARGVVFLPGRACFPTEPPEGYFRLNFSHATEESIDIGIGRLLEVIREAAAVASPRHADSSSRSPVV
jgi:DNA-binding transcriptional MocR family regulator